MAKNPIDHHVGKQIRQRRWLMGQTQQQLAQAVGIRFQQIQKYESGSNRVSASRLWELARALNVDVTYFYEGLNDPATEASQTAPANGAGALSMVGVLADKEAHDMLRAYVGLADGPRRRLLELAIAMHEINALR